MLRGIFGPKRDEETGEWTELHNEGLNDLYSTPTIASGEIEKNLPDCCSHLYSSCGSAKYR
jgi:hypothetical protein